MLGRPRRVAASQGRFGSFGSLLRKLRQDLHFHSSAALSKKAGLSLNYVSILERGDARPTTATVRRLAAALQLDDQEEAELLKAAKLAGEPERVQAAIAGPRLWRHLPGILLNEVNHDPLALFGPEAEELTVDLARGIGSLLGWLALVKAPPTPARRKRVQAAASRVFEWSLRLAREHPNLGWSDHTAAYNAASALPVIWRNELFGRRETTARLAAMVRHWMYSFRGPRGRACVDVRLKDQDLNYDYSFYQATPEMILNVHDAMVAYELWTVLELARALGRAPPESAQEFQLGVQLSPYNGDLYFLLTAAAAPTETEQRARADHKLFDDIHETAMSVDLALRLFKVPDLAARVLERSQAEVEAALRTVAPIVGGLSVRFPPPALPTPKS